MLKKFQKAVALLCVLVLAAGCQDEQMIEGSGANGRVVTITAKQGVGSRTAIAQNLKGGKAQAIWSEDDEIFVFGADAFNSDGSYNSWNSAAKGILKLQSISDDGTTATFKGVVTGDASTLKYSVYPAPVSNQDYVDMTQNVNGEFNAPMFGTISNSSINFSASCGVLELPIKNLPQESNSFKLVAASGEPSAENCIQLGAKAKIALIDGKIGFKYEPAELTVINAVKDDRNSIFVPVIGSTLVDGVALASDSKYKLYSPKGDEYQEISNDEASLLSGKMIQKSHFKQIALVGGGIELPTEETAQTGADGGATLSVSQAVVDVVVPTEATSLSVDLNNTSGTEAVVTVTSIPESLATVTLKDESEQAKAVTVVLPATDPESSEPVQTIPAIEVDMPATTVTLTADNGNNLNIDTMTASTADQTLIVGSGVKIEDLTIEKGNVEVYGEIDKISSTAAETITVVLKPGGKVGEVGEGIVVVDESDVITTSPLHVFMDKEFSRALLDVLGSDMVTINANDFAEMTRANMNAVTELHMSPTGWYNIQSVAGIENFVNLESASLYINNVKALDLSKNTKLKNLLVVAPLSSLDLSKNTELETLDLTTNDTGMTSLDLSNNTKLSKLRYYRSWGDGLSSINLSGCTLLTDIQIDYATNLTQLEVPNKEAVTRLMIINTPLKFDLTAFPNLKELGCDGMYATEKNLSAIPTNLKAQLTVLNCSNNGLESFDISEYPQLQSLTCTNNQMMALDITSATNLTELYCGNQASGVLVLTLADSQKDMWTEMVADYKNANVVLPNEAFKVLLKSIEGAQQSPHEGERIAVYNWASAARISGENSTYLAAGRYSDSYSIDYHNQYLTKWINDAAQTITIANQVNDLLPSGHAKDFNMNVASMARIWRTVMIAEYVDNFGPYPLGGFDGGNTLYSSVKEVYYYMLDELKAAVENISSSVVPTSEEAAFDPMFGFDAEKWMKYGNSLRLRLAMRMSEVDRAKAQTEFEAVDKNMLIATMADIAKVKELNQWNAYAGIYSRSWNYISLPSTMSNILTGLGGVAVSEQRPDLAQYTKPMDYLGLQFADHYAECTDNPTNGYWMDGIPENLDPRALRLYCLPNDQAADNFIDYGSTTRHDQYYMRDDNGNSLGYISASHTWNCYPAGSRSAWSPKFAMNGVVSGAYPYTLPVLSKTYGGNSEGARVWFGPWETHFLLAEAALYGWNTGGVTAEAAYGQGIRTSFEYFGVSQYVDAYLQSEDYNRVGVSVKFTHTTEPTDFTADYVDGYSGVAGTMTYEYPDASKSLYKDGLNTQLAKIITQKYIAQAPYCTLEMWNDYRRLGLPWFDMPANEMTMTDSDMQNSWAPSLWQTGQIISVYPQRMRYPSDLPNLSGATGVLGGENTVITPLWWAKQQ